MKNVEIFYIDPPWPQKKSNKRAVRPNQGKELDYETLTVDAIEEILKDKLQYAAENHNIFLWTVDKFLFDAEKMMENMNYTRHARIIWNKENGIAPAYTIRYTHEYLLWFYKKGHMLLPDPSVRGKYTSIIVEKSTVHSRKPLAAYKMLEDMFPGTVKAELFAREKRDGWISWGNETDKFEARR